MKSCIILPEFELPKGQCCCLTLIVFDDGCVCRGAEIVGKAITVPDHSGDLISRDKLLRRLNLYEPRMDCAIKEVTDAIAIIPSDKEENDE